MQVTDVKYKGQSAIEYLTTYGWMLIVIAVVGGAVFTTVQDSSQIQTVSGLSNDDVQVDDFGVTTDDNLQLELRAASQNKVENVNISITDEETTRTVYSCSQPTIPVASTQVVEIIGVQESQNTNRYKIEITYDTGSLDDLTESGTIEGEISLNESFSCISADGNLDLILDTGGEIQSIQIQDTLRLGTEGETGCLGELCNQVNPGDGGDPVQVSGDNMTGTLTVNNLLNATDCIVTDGKQGGVCTLDYTSDSGELSNTNNIMYGQLSTPTLKTQQDTCVGGKC